MTFVKDGQLIAAGVSDLSGHVELSLPALTGGVALVTASKPNYFSDEQEVSIEWKVEGLIISLSGDEIHLSWNSIPSGFGEPVVYEVHRSEVPFFECTQQTLLGTTSDTQYIDADHGNVIHAFYRVLATTP